jgi:hypothetical protein
VSLEQIGKKIKSEVVINVFYRISIFIGILLIGLNITGLFLLKDINNSSEIKILKDYSADIFVKKIQNEKGSGEIVASKNGKKYYYLHCSGVKRIKDENRVYFLTTVSAESAGYTIAANCK